MDNPAPTPEFKSYWDIHDYIKKLIDDENLESRALVGLAQVLNFLLEQPEEKHGIEKGKLLPEDWFKLDFTPRDVEHLIKHKMVEKVPGGYKVPDVIWDFVEAGPGGLSDMCNDLIDSITGPPPDECKVKVTSLVEAPTGKFDAATRANGMGEEGRKPYMVIGRSNGEIAWFHISIGTVEQLTALQLQVNSSEEINLWDYGFLGDFAWANPPTKSGPDHPGESTHLDR